MSKAEISYILCMVWKILAVKEQTFYFSKKCQAFQFDILSIQYQENNKYIVKEWLFIKLIEGKSHAPSESCLCAELADFFFSCEKANWKFWKKYLKFFSSNIFFWMRCRRYPFGYFERIQLRMHYCYKTSDGTSDVKKTTQNGISNSMFGDCVIQGKYVWMIIFWD